MNLTKAMPFLKGLRDDMRDKEKAVVISDIRYKKINYYVATCLLTEKDKQIIEQEQLIESKYVLVKLIFIVTDDLKTQIACYANSSGIVKHRRTIYSDLRKFFKIESNENFWGWERTFSEYLGTVLPRTVPEMKEKEKHVLIHAICKNAGYNPNKIYRNYIFRNGKINGKQKHRTEYNGQLASLQFPNLYPLFASDKTVSFAFTEDKEKEKSESEILENFRKIDNQSIPL